MIWARDVKTHRPIGERGSATGNFIKYELNSIGSRFVSPFSSPVAALYNKGVAQHDRFPVGPGAANAERKEYKLQPRFVIKSFSEAVARLLISFVQTIRYIRLLLIIPIQCR